MADTKITALTELNATPDDADVVAIVDDPSGTPATKKITVANLVRGGFSGALVKLTANESVANSTLTAVPWDAETYDVWGWWDSGSPTRLIVPSGVSRVRLVANIRWATDGVGNRIAEFHKDGSEFEGRARLNVTANTIGGSASIYNLAGPVISVSAGNYFELKVQQGSGGPLNLESGTETWCAIEKAG